MKGTDSSSATAAHAPTRRPRTKRKQQLLAAVLVCALLAMGAAALGCAPQNKPADAAPQEQTATEQSEQSGGIAGMMDFTANNAGYFPSTADNEQFVNAGNRGCNSCHDDLAQVMYRQEPEHIVQYMGFGKKGTIQDCLVCHDFHGARSGIYFGDAIHVAHYSNEVFAENGNCWSCHAVDSKGDLGEYQLTLFEQIQYTPALGGFPDGASTPVRWWCESRGYEGGYRTGVVTEEQPVIDVTLNQDPTDEKDSFIINNYGTIEVDAKDWKLSFTEGVKNPRSFTLEELQAMPQSEITATQVCATNGLGGVLASNIPVSGVKLSYLIEQCGGLVDGVNQINMDSGGIDAWDQHIATSLVLPQDPIVALQFFGHELTANQGYPATMVVPGLTGMAWEKFLSNVSFTQEETPNINIANNATNYGNPENATTRADGTTLNFPVNTAIFQNDGLAGKVGEPLNLSGYAWSWSATCGGIAKVEFSLDYGNNWTAIDVPETFDPTQWTQWNFSWTPEKAGTYVIHVRAESDTAWKQSAPASIIVTVAE